MVTHLRSTRVRRRQTLVFTLCLAISTLAANAQAQPSPAASDAERVAPFVNETTFLVMKVDLDSLRLPDLQNLESLPAELRSEAVNQTVEKYLQQIRSTIGNQPVYATVGVPIHPQRIPLFVFARPKENTDSLVDYLKSKLQFDATSHEGFVVVSPSKELKIDEMLRTFPAVERDEIPDAFGAASGYPVQAILLPPAHIRRTLEELMPELPAQLGGGPSRVLTEGVIWAAVGVKPDQLKVDVTIQSKDEQAAERLATQLPKLVRAAYDSLTKDYRPIPESAFVELADNIQLQVAGDQIKITLEGNQSAGSVSLLANVAAALNQTSQRQRDMKRFKQIALGLHNYHDVYRMFPPHEKYRNREGKHHLSWRVHILPYVEQHELYKQFKLDEPWDSPHNKELLAKMPDIFQGSAHGAAISAKVKQGYTTFVAPQNDDTILGSGEKSRLQDCRDGTSNTVFFVEVKPALAVPWTAPDDYAFDAADPANGVFVDSDGRWMAAFADGSVRRLRSDIKPEIIKRLFEKSDGEVIDYDAIQ